MCSLIALLRPGQNWPLLLAANRDEMASRPSRPPGRHWPDRPHVLAGLDVTAGGSWMGLNDDGVVACVLNRVGSLGPAAGKRSRGELVLEALDHAAAGDAAWAMADLDPAAYRSFNLFIADGEQAFWLRHRGEEAEAVEVMKLRPGLSMLTAHDLNDLSSPRIARYLPRFKTAPVPEPEQGDWSAWEALLAERDLEDPAQGLTISLPSGFGTVSSSLVAVPGRPRTLRETPRRPIWRYAEGPPDRAPFYTLFLG
ncbi:MAG TPA: NRDE family protein [Kiloniellales bacterium]|nr:NRDE family protein [Kiloniellales bacterium]